jgi:hypothetical protein
MLYNFPLGMMTALDRVADKSCKRDEPMFCMSCLKSKSTMKAYLVHMVQLFTNFKGYPTPSSKIRTRSSARHLHNEAAWGPVLHVCLPFAVPF